MIFQVKTTLFFDGLSIPEQIKDALITVWQHARVVNPCMPDQECSRVEILKCYHDEDPHRPCESIFERDNCPVCPPPEEPPPPD